MKAKLLILGLVLTSNVVTNVSFANSPIDLSAEDCITTASSKSHNTSKSDLTESSSDTSSSSDESKTDAS